MANETPGATESTDLAGTGNSDAVIPSDILHDLDMPGVPPSVREKIEIYFQQTTTNGPIPPPSLIREYGQAVPGLDQKIVEWAGAQLYARLEREKLTAEGTERRMDRAQRNFMLVAVLGLFLSAAVGVWGSPWVAAVIAIVSVGGPSAATILSRTLSRSPPGGERVAERKAPSRRRKSAGGIVPPGKPLEKREG